MKRFKFTAAGFLWQKVRPFWASDLDKTTGQKYGWNPFSVKGMGRFGGGWAFKLGVQVSASMTDWVFDLGLGSIRVIYKKEVEA